MTFKELCDEVNLRCIALNGQIMFQPKATSNEDLVKRLKDIQSDLRRIPNAPLEQATDNIETVLYNLQTEIDELEMADETEPKPILIDNCKEVWINHEPIVMLEE